MTSIVTAALRAAFIMLALGLLGGSVQAQSALFGCACLHNNTQHTMKFRYKWSDGEWTNDYLRSGNHETLYWRYAAGSTASPNLTFQIDVDLSGGVAWTTYARACNRRRTSAKRWPTSSTTTSTTSPAPTVNSCR